MPPANHFGSRKTRRPPHIYSADEINRLIEAALCNSVPSGLQSQTYATLIALLAATGLRISEALKLQYCRYHARRAADPGDQVPENPSDAAA